MIHLCLSLPFSFFLFLSLFSLMTIDQNSYQEEIVRANGLAYHYYTNRPSSASFSEENGKSFVDSVEVTVV
ncbi:hypothetical protein RO3G_13383 [Rhizopus delemar RA 99-880]|uniref:Uncharacterized protein n=1 Tax=Rhizopus delemar (strain RA 99-880 / ATCC MYA-4621 / FGSC 9543 / NRRL 43880) TaxID=246409 RepID=I1CJP2_RHIO9|nr:hypothetical protein RO3G_13383 [Rhizopus delemar RA 99-880]|eukprot:EIE88672.1 hypothetical protein RO3G_13383 [Rhizopus delemar RA 99-880]